MRVRGRKWHRQKKKKKSTDIAICLVMIAFRDVKNALDPILPCASVLMVEDYLLPSFY